MHGVIHNQFVTKLTLHEKSETENNIVIIVKPRFALLQDSDNYTLFGLYSSVIAMYSKLSDGSGFK